MLFTFQYVPICFYYFSFYDTITDFVSKIYIPICFYYFVDMDIWHWTSDGIYIPICFYYFTDAQTSTAEYCNLHSNMFLLFRKSAMLLSICLLNLHSNMFLLFRKWQNWKNQQKNQFTFQYVSIISIFLILRCRMLALIYIPICFYYLSVSDTAWSSRVLFTFQYVSII